MKFGGVKEFMVVTGNNDRASFSLDSVLIVPSCLFCESVLGWRIACCFTMSRLWSQGEVPVCLSWKTNNDLRASMTIDRPVRIVTF